MADACTLILPADLSFADLAGRLTALGWVQRPIAPATPPLVPGEPELAQWVEEPGGPRLIYTLNPVIRLRVLRIDGRDAAARREALARALDAQGPEAIAQALDAARRSGDARELLRCVLAAGALQATALEAPVRALVLYPEPSVAQAAARVQLELVHARACSLALRARAAASTDQAARRLAELAELTGALDAIAGHALPVLAALAGAGDDVLLGLQPTAEDCAAVLSDELAAPVCAAYDQLFATGLRVEPTPAQQEIQVNACPVELMDTEHPLARRLPIGYRALAPYLRPGHVWLAWRYRTPGAAAGLAFDGLVHVRGAWVWFPKPYRVVGALVDPRGR